MSNASLFALVVLIWGSTWIAITFQYGNVHPTVSVCLRFLIAACLLYLYCKFRRLPLHLPRHVHVKMALAGLCLYTLDYSFLYQSQQYIVSAIVALMSSGMIYINVVLRRVLLKKAIRLEVITGASLGMIGIGLIFYPEFSKVDASEYLWVGICFALASFFCASLGNVVSEKILDQGAPVIQMNFWAMSYGVFYLFFGILVSDIPITYSVEPSYYLSLLYLAVFGSVVAFGAYMQLVKQMGSDKAAYVVLVYPIVALILSTLFEGYVWHIEAFIGVGIVLLGNGIAMGKIPTRFVRKN